MVLVRHVVDLDLLHIAKKGQGQIVLKCKDCRGTGYDKNLKDIK